MHFSLYRFKPQAPVVYITDKHAIFSTVNKFIPTDQNEVPIWDNFIILPMIFRIRNLFYADDIP
jgi:hypothetical protein